MNQELSLLLKDIEGVSIRVFYRIFDVKKTDLPDYTIKEIISLTESDIQNCNKAQQKKIKEVVNKLTNETSRFIDFHKQNFASIILPLNYHDNNFIGDSILEVINGLSLWLKNRNPDESRNSKFFAEYFDFSTKNIPSRKDLAKKYNLHEERIRQIIFVQTNLKELFSGQSIENVSLNSLFVKNVQNLISNSLNKTNFHTFFSSERKLNEKHLGRIAEIFNCDYVNIADQFFLLSSSEVNLFREHHRAFTQTVNREFLPLSKEQIYSLVKKNLKKSYKFSEEFINSLIECYYLIEKVQTNQNVILFRCKWEHLFSVILKAQRIIYDSENQQLDKKQILSEFNRREKGLNIELTQDSQLVLKRLKNFKAQANGVWSYSPDTEHPQSRTSLISILKEYIVSQNGKVTFDDTLNYLEQNRYKYSKKSIRTYLTELCLISISDTNLFVMEKYSKIHPEIELIPRRQKDVQHKFIHCVISILQNKTDKMCAYTLLMNQVEQELLAEQIVIRSQSNMLTYLRKFIEMGIITKKIINEEAFIELDETELLNHNLSTLGKQVEPEYKTKIRSLAINYLKEQSNFECSLSKLREEFIQYVKEGIKENIFYKIFEDSQYFIKEGDSKNRIIRLNPSLLPEPKAFTEDVLDPVSEIELPVSSVVISKKKEELEIIYQSIPYSWAELKSQMKTELADYGFTENALELGIEKFYAVLGGDNKGRWEQSILKSINDFWFKATDFFDRESYIIKLAHGYETYLKSFKELPESTNGISDVVSEFPEMENLRNYKFIHKSINYTEVDNQKKNFSYILGNAIYLGNKLRHDAKDESLNMGVLKQTKTITDIVALYVYTASILANPV